MNKKYITEFGASCEYADNSEFIQKAVESMDSGVLVIPCGTFLTSTFFLKSNITLYLDEGACLKAMPDESKYMNNGFYDSFGESTNSFIIVKNSENVSIEGKGIIDISGYDFLDYEISNEDIECWGENAAQIPAKPKKRIRRPILFDNCTNTHVSNIKIVNSPCWTLTFNNCEDIKVSDITIDNDIRTPHSDGIHICGSKNAVITGCNFKCGDDCIALTCLLDESLVCKNIVITNCIMQSSSAAIRIGHMGGKVENVLANNICINDTNRGIAIFAGDNGYVKNVSVSNVIMDTHILAGGWWGKGEPFVICSANSNGVIENVKISGLTAQSENIGVIVGTVNNLTIHNLQISIIESKNRKYAKNYDIAPNGKIDKQNDFVGEYYIENTIKINS